MVEDCFCAYGWSKQIIEQHKLIMILPSYTEKEILSELIADYAIVKRLIKKRADKHLLQAQKRGSFIRETEEYVCDVRTSSNNKWKVEIEYNQKNRIPWFFRTCCIVEGEKKTKDYYIVRGINTEEPYYVKVTTHALMRYRERNKLEGIDGLTLAELACLTFEHRETAICVRYVDTKFNLLLTKFDDLDDLKDMSYLILTNRGEYYGQRTAEGNYVFKTYISTSMGILEWLNYRKGKNTKWSKEGELMNHLLLLHQYFNKSLYDKDILERDLYSVFNKDEEYVMKEDSPFILLKH